MAAATIMELAKGVAQDLAQYNAELTLNPDYELRNMKTRRVVVVPVAKQMDIESRAGTKYHHTINVGVIHKCRTEDDIEPLIALAETIGQGMLRKRIAGEICTSAKWEPLYAHEEIRAKGQFTSVIVLTFTEVTA